MALSHELKIQHFLCQEIHLRKYSCSYNEMRRGLHPCTGPTSRAGEAIVKIPDALNAFEPGVTEAVLLLHRLRNTISPTGFWHPDFRPAKE
jgi:hypothetical protein